MSSGLSLLSLKNLQDTHSRDIIGTGLPSVLKHLRPDFRSWDQSPHDPQGEG